MLKRFIIPVTFALSALLCSAAVVAQEQLSPLQRDFNEPIRILAENDFIDLAANIYRATGNVRITQGTLKITADELEATGFEERDGETQMFILRGSPATYQQEIEPGVTDRAGFLNGAKSLHFIVLALVNVRNAKRP
ncbi:MAG: hypothetical protein M1363_02845, partial [Gammaproteobacteria bacterium]|nr:hypothetical protein [Gammaproteobacteria bacterium]